MDIKSMSRKELEKLRTKIDKQLDRIANNEKKAALDAAERAAKAHGYSLAELSDMPLTKSTRAPVAPKYQNPDNPEQSWSGRGRQPVWFRDALAAGKTPADMEID